MPDAAAAPDPRPLALVTGASSGLGEATARRLCADGYRVILLARRAERLEEIAKGLPGALVLPVDLLAADGPAKVAAAVDAAGGQLSVLVNNAGAGGRGTFADAGFEGVRKTMALNFDAQLRVTEAVLPALRAAAPSSIVIISSVSGKIARPGAGAYSASKFALNGWAEALRAEESAHGVHVGVVLPGFISTEGFPQKELTGSWKTSWIVGKPEHVSDAVAKLIKTRKPERYAPAPWKAMALLAALLPGVMARISAKPAMTPTTKG